MSAKTCAEKTQPSRSFNKKKSGDGGVRTKRTATADAAAHDCCLDEQATEGLPSSTGSTSTIPAVPSESATPAEQPGKRVCKGDSA